MSIHSVPFTSIPDLKKEKLRLGDDLSFHLFDNDGALKMIVEATRLGSDKRKITGYANMDQYQILRLWSGLDRLVKERGLVDQVQTEAEYVQARREQNEACSENFSRHRQRMKSSSDAAPAVSQPPAEPVEQDDSLTPSQQEVCAYVLQLEENHGFKNDNDSISDAVHLACRALDRSFSENEHRAICDYLMNPARGALYERQARVVDYVLKNHLMTSQWESPGHMVRYAASMVDVELSDAENEQVYADLLSR